MESNKRRVLVNVNCMPMTIAHFAVVAIVGPMNNMDFVDVVFQQGDNDVALVEIDEQVVVVGETGGSEEQTALDTRFEVKRDVKSLSQRK